MCTRVMCFIYTNDKGGFLHFYQFLCPEKKCKSWMSLPGRGFHPLVLPPLPPPPPHLWGIAAVPAGTYWALTGLFGLRHLLFQGRNAVVTAHCSDHSRYWTNQGGVYKVVKGVHGKPVRCTAAHATSIAVLYIYIYIANTSSLPCLEHTHTHSDAHTNTHAPRHTHVHTNPPPPPLCCILKQIFLRTCQIKSQPAHLTDCGFCFQ